MAKTLFKLGPLVFSQDGAAPQQFANSSEYRWPAQARLGRRPALQFVGIGEQTIRLSGTIYPGFDPTGSGKVVGCKKIHEIRQLADHGLPLDFTDGMGNNYGRWVIRRVEGTDSELMSNGAPRKQEFSVELARYGDDDLGEQSIIYQQTASGPQISTSRLSTFVSGNVWNTA